MGKGRLGATILPMLPNWLLQHWKFPTILLIVILAAGAAGRFLAPTKILKETHVEQVDRTQDLFKEIESLRQQISQVTDAQRELHRHVERLYDPVSGKLAKVTSDTNVDSTVHTHTVETQVKVVNVDHEVIVYRDRVTDTLKLVERERPRWNLAIDVSQDVRHPFPLNPFFGGTVTYRLIGPFFVGARVSTVPTASVLVGMSF